MDYCIIRRSTSSVGRDGPSPDVLRQPIWQPRDDVHVEPWRAERVLAARTSPLPPRPDHHSAAGRHSTAVPRQKRRHRLLHAHVTTRLSRMCDDISRFS